MGKSYSGSETLKAVLEQLGEFPGKTVLERSENKNDDSSKKASYRIKSSVIYEAVENMFMTTYGKGIQTGFKDLDYMIGGLEKGELVVLAARPSMGKTAFALNLTGNIAIKKKEPVVYYSLGQPSAQIVQRLLGIIGNMDFRFRKNVDDNEMKEIAKAVDSIREGKLLIDTTSGVSPEKINDHILSLDEKPELIIIDYLQVMRESMDCYYRENVRNIVKSLKCIATETGCPILLLSQLNRNPDERPDHRPCLFDLRGRAAIEEFADKILFLYRDAYYYRNTKRTGIAEVIVAKNRRRACGTIKLSWIPEHQIFQNLDYESIL